MDREDGDQDCCEFLLENAGVVGLYIVTCPGWKLGQGRESWPVDTVGTPHFFRLAGCESGEGAGTGVVQILSAPMIQYLRPPRRGALPWEMDWGLFHASIPNHRVPSRPVRCILPCRNIEYTAPPHESQSTNTLRTQHMAPVAAANSASILTLQYLPLQSSTPSDPSTRNSHAPRSPTPHRLALHHASRKRTPVPNLPFEKLSKGDGQLNSTQRRHAPVQL
jgi:hypothetical protein